MSVPGPVLGPCQTWITADDVAACCPLVTPELADNWAAGWTVDDALEQAAVEASMVLFELSGRQFSGLCERTVRPCRKKCCSGSIGYPNDCGDHCGCGSLERIKLAGYPVREIEEVKLDGDVVDADSYRLDDWRYLVRLDDPGPPAVKRRWPACQNLALADDQPGTFSVSYKHGVDPPPIGLAAASELACRLFQVCLPSGDNANPQIPVGVARVVRQGIEFDRGLLVQFLYAAKPSGLIAVDAFIAAYGGGISRRPAVWSPDVASYGRPAGG